MSLFTKYTRIAPGSVPTPTGDDRYYFVDPNDDKFYSKDSSGIVIPQAVAQQPASAILGITPPSDVNASGNAGDIRYSSNYIYICVSANTWRRALIVAWI